MQSLIESYNEEKGKNKRLKKDIAKSEKDDAMYSDPDFEAYVPSFEESSSFPSKVREDILFNATNSTYYQPMIDAIASCGAGFKDLYFHDIKGPLLQDEVQRIEEYLTEFKQSWTKPKQNAQLCLMDGLMVKDAQFQFCLLDEVVMEVGVENVVQVITNNVSNYIATRKMLEKKHHTIWWSPCAAHCLDLMLEDIGKIEWVKKCVEATKSITRYIYNHSWVLNLMRKQTGGKELVRSAIIRFSTNFLSL
eukprot:PITA_14426